MVLLVQRFGRFLKLSSKLDNHHHHPPPPSEALPASLQAFRSHVSNCLNQFSLNSKPGSEFLSLIWIHQCFELLPIINKAFAKLVVDIDYPMSKWEAASTEEYLKYSLTLLELLNSISSGLSHLNQARLSLCHALSQGRNSHSLAKDRLREIQSKHPTKDFKVEGNEERLCSGKECVIHQALLVVKSIGFWVCGVVLSGLCSDVKPYMEMRKPAGGFFVDSSLKALDSSICKEMMEKGGVVKELKEVNGAVAWFVAAMANGKGDDAGKDELQRRLEVLEKELQGIGKEADGLFSDVLAGRNELLHCLRQQKQ